RPLAGGCGAALVSLGRRCRATLHGAGRHHEVSKEGFPPQNNSNQIIRGLRERQRAQTGLELLGSSDLPALASQDLATLNPFLGMPLPMGKEAGKGT
ncbi:MYCBPAP isoform 15, partial [Pongo abelii]